MNEDEDEDELLDAEDEELEEDAVGVGTTLKDEVGEAAGTGEAKVFAGEKIGVNGCWLAAGRSSCRVVVTLSARAERGGVGSELDVIEEIGRADRTVEWAGKGPRTLAKLGGSGLDSATGRGITEAAAPGCAGLGTDETVSNADSKASRPAVGAAAVALITGAAAVGGAMARRLRVMRLGAGSSSES